MKKTTNTKQNNKIDDNQDDLSFSDLGISASILKVLAKLGLEKPTPIQKKSIAVSISGQDLIGIAQTGTGKTLAFGIPMLERLGKEGGQGLVITPTRELAIQVDSSLKKIGQEFSLRSAVLIGGEAIDRQLYQLRKKPHIIVATPGRLIDHLRRRTLKLDRVKVLVLDEADMMFDMGFAPQIKDVLKQAPKERQTMLFSATMPPAIVKIASDFMKLPVSIEVAPPGTTAALVNQEMVIINPVDRFDYLLKILREHSGSVLIFVRTKYGADNLAARLRDLEHKAVEIHSNLSLGRRKTALEGFKSKKQRILVATDVAARGLDISGIELVVNYNLPDSSDDYVHRIGRTGRAGLAGKAISLATPDQRKNIVTIEKLINKSIKTTDLAPSRQKKDRRKEGKRGAENVSENKSGDRRKRRYPKRRNRTNKNFGSKENKNKR